MKFGIAFYWTGEYHYLFRWFFFLKKMSCHERSSTYSFWTQRNIKCICEAHACVWACEMKGCQCLRTTEINIFCCLLESQDLKVSHSFVPFGNHYWHTGLKHQEEWSQASLFPNLCLGSFTASPNPALSPHIFPGLKVLAASPTLCWSLSSCFQKLILLHW